MARSKNADSAWNARRRYFRAAERNLKKAEQSSGATAAKYKELARQQTEAAIQTFSEKNIKSGIRNKNLNRLVNELNINVDDAFKNVGGGKKAEVIKRSETQLESVLGSDDFRRESEARALLNNDAIGSRILGGLVDIWKDDATVTGENGVSKIDNTKILPSLFKYFKVDNLADMLDKLEQSIGEELYKMPSDSENFYEYIKVLIQTKVLEGTLVQ